MLQMIDGEGTGEDTVSTINIDVALESVLNPKQNEPPKILPNLDLPHDDILVKEKGLEQEQEGNVCSSSNLEANVRHLAGLKNIIHLVLHRLMYLQNQGSFQYKDIIGEYTRNVEVLIEKHRVFSLNDILSEETDPVLLRQLLDDIVDSQMSSLAGITPDPVLAALATTNAELPAPIFYDVVGDFWFDASDNVRFEYGVDI